MNRTLATLFFAGALLAQKPVTHEGRDSLELSSGKVTLVVTKEGGAFASFVLAADPKHINPLWDPNRMAREAGAPSRFGASMGHFLCVDGFGPTTKEEQAAGLPGHGEANRRPMDIQSSSDTHIQYKARLPLVQEVLTRKITLDGQVALIESELESEVAFDRPILWGEHATIGAPFLKPGKTIVDQSVTRCRTKPYSTPARGIRTFPPGKDFVWPVYGSENLRIAPTADNRLDHIGCLMDPKREREFITAINTEDNLLIGWMWNRDDYPWVQHWMNYPTNKMYSWGLEFGMQPYDMTKREIVALSPMFDTPAFRWLPAKSKVTAKFLMFVTQVPNGFRKVDDVRLEDNKIVIEERATGRKVTLDYTKGL